MSMSQTEFVSLMVLLKRSYPGTFWEDGHWGDLIRMFWKRFSRYGDDVIRASFAEAVDKHPNRFPTLGQMTAIFDSNYEKAQVENMARMKNKLLPAPSAGKDVARAQFYELCSKAMRVRDGDLEEISNRHIIEGILVSLDVYIFGEGPPERVLGDEFSESAEKRYSISNHLMLIWKKKGYEVSDIARGLRKIPEKCIGWPTEGLIDDLIKGRNVDGWPGGQVKGEREGRSEDSGEVFGPDWLVVDAPA